MQNRFLRALGIHRTGIGDTHETNENEGADEGASSREHGSSLKFEQETMMGSGAREEKGSEARR
jgi:hypothetical protein